MSKIIVFAVVTLLYGCAAIEPDALRLEATHESHLTNHWPFKDGGYEVGRDVIAVGARWQQGPVVEEVSEGYAFHGLDGCEICPTREVFRATIAYEWRLK